MEKSIFDFLFEDKETINKDAPEDNLNVDASSPKARKSKDSLDDQIDALILKYGFYI